MNTKWNLGVLLCLCFIALMGCSQEEELSQEEDLAQLIEGDWFCRTADISLHFSDGKTQHSNLAFAPGETLLSFEVDKIEDEYISGKITNTGILGNSSGTWSYDFGDDSGYLVIIFTSESPLVYLYRHLEFSAKDKMTMKVSDGLLVQQYNDNGLVGTPKLTGGAVLETYEKQK